MIKFGMSLPQVFNQLYKGYQKFTGRKPEGLDLIKLKQEAMQKFQEMKKVVDMKGKPIDPSKPIMGGTQQGEALKSGIMKATGAGPEVVEGINPKFIDFTINSFKKMDGIKVMKEGNKVIKREGPYKDLTKNDAKKILDAVDDKMKNIDMDPEDMFATGGRAGFDNGGAPSIKYDFDKEQEPMGPGFETNDPEEALKEIVKRMINVEPAKIPLSKDMQLMFDLDRANIGGSKDIGGGILSFGINKGFGRDDTGMGFNFSKKFAEGGRIGLKKGSGFFKSLLPFSGDNKYSKQLEGIIYGSEGFNEIYNLLSSVPFAEGGRAAFKDGPKDPRRRGFMKAAVGIASMLPFGIGKGVKMAAPVVTKAAEITGPALSKIVDTVMSLGKTISQSGRRLKELTTKKKHKGIEVEEDIQDGSYIIKKGEKEIYYKPGRMDETGGIEDDIIEVIENTVTKKAGGGIARMLGE